MRAAHGKGAHAVRDAIEVKPAAIVSGGRELAAGDRHEGIAQRTAAHAVVDHAADGDRRRRAGPCPERGRESGEGNPACDRREGDPVAHTLIWITSRTAPPG